MKIETKINSLQRIPTDLYSFDYALGDLRNKKLGIPVPGIIEIYGPTHVGKSTLAYHLSSQINPEGRVVLCDFEGIDIDYVRYTFEKQGFQGTLKIIDAVDNKGKARSHEDMLNELTEEFYNPETTAGIVDSIGMIAPIFEIESDIEEGYGAKRATIVARFVRRLMIPMISMELPRPLFAINHSHQILGGGYGHQSSGGVALDHAKIASAYLTYSSSDFIKTADEVLAYVIKGRVEKLRYGGRGREFKFVVVPNYGVRPNLTALIDAIDLGIVERGAVVKMDGTSLGRISELFNADLNGEDAVFEPVHAALTALR